MQSSTPGNLGKSRGSTSTIGERLTKRRPEMDAGPILRMAWMSLHRLQWRGDGRDIVQEAFLRVWMSNGRFVEAKLPAYVRTVVRNLVYDATSGKSSRTVYGVDTDEFVGANDHEADLLRSEIRSAVSEAVVTLPQPYREIVQLRLRGLSIAEISSLSRLSSGAVDSRLRRAHDLLRAKLVRFAEV
jgi:RNA polymerase sigma-70 factor, ECF subfamily